MATLKLMPTISLAITRQRQLRWIDQVYHRGEWSVRWLASYIDNRLAIAFNQCAPDRVGAVMLAY